MEPEPEPGEPTTEKWLGSRDRGGTQPPRPMKGQFADRDNRGTAAPSAILATGGERREMVEERRGGESEHVALCDFCARLNDSTYKVLQNCGCNSVSMCFCGSCLQVCALCGMCDCLEQSVCVCVCIEKFVNE